MPIITPSKAQPECDVAIAGSGAGGAQMAYTPTLAGSKCVMLEAGWNAIGFVGNALAGTFESPPPEVRKMLDVEQTVK